ncbi:hypothetical protein ILYODFUR_034951 [Ilyodon furcidens]|uniref:Uncharacterized protein n=1 Tax=Ilyodon furcidens TaxID=33524 RepID=A0ABV0UXR3_9TELE
MTEKEKTKKKVVCALANAQLHAEPETDSILEKSRTAVYSRSTCLFHFLKSYTECLEQDSFQSNPGANWREGAWWTCVFRNRWKQSGTRLKIVVNVHMLDLRHDVKISVPLLQSK